MQDDNISQFFIPAANGDSLSLYKTVIDNTEAVRSSEIKARNRQFKNTPASTLALDGMPGIPFERGLPNPDLFYQGEDAVYDLFLFNGAPISSAEYDVSVLVKTSPRAYNVVWQGTLDNGVYPAPNESGYYEVWIPSNVTATFFAGTYYLDVLVHEKLGSGKGRYDRKYLALQTVFNIEYSNFSPSPETLAGNPKALSRAGMEEVWPNQPDTIGKRSGGKAGGFSDPSWANIDPTLIQ
jgi:hypothetical protein